MKGSLSDSWRLWVLFGMGHSPLYTKIWHQSRYQARPRGWHWSLSSLITTVSSSCWEDKRIRLLGVKMVSKIMRHTPHANSVSGVKLILYTHNFPDYLKLPCCQWISIEFQSQSNPRRKTWHQNCDNIYIFSECNAPSLTAILLK